MTTLKQKIAVVLAETGTDILQCFFESGMTDEYGEYDDEELTEFRTALTDNNIKFEHKENYGGEGMGEDYWSVYKFTDDTDEVFVKFEGWYQSYNGSEYEEYYFVNPKQVMVTQYFKEE
jgi:hypothetical protein